MKNKIKRNVNLDYIRALAVFSLISVHFFRNSNFYSANLVGKKMFLALLFKTFSMICVPLFLLLSGYLLNGKKIGKKYYKKIIYIILTFLVVSIIQIFYENIFLNAGYDFKEAFLYIFGFKTCYSWYINMYIGLFLFVPFLNIVYNNLKTKKEKNVLISTFIILTVVPSIFNNFNDIVPNWWVCVWPIMYYFVGCYLNEYEIKIASIKNLLIILVLIISFSLLQFCLSYPFPLSMKLYNSEWYGVTTFCLAILVFTLLKNIDSSKIPKFITKVVTKISEVSLPIYMISWIFDSIAYKILNERISNIPTRMLYYLPTVLFIFIASFLSSILIDNIVKFTLSKGEKLWKIKK